MRAWIARDDNGHATMFFDNPELEGADTAEGGYWCGDIFVVPKGSAAQIADAIGLKPGHKQPIELTACPLGEAVRGGDVSK